MFPFAQSAAGEEPTEYHLEAGIAACHCAAQDYESTDWRQILSLYDRLVELDQSPVVALNRAVAVAEVHGPVAGLAAAHGIRNPTQLDFYYRHYDVPGEFSASRG